MLVSQIDSLLEDVDPIPQTKAPSGASRTQSLAVSAAALKSLIQAIAAFLHEQQLETTIVVKCPDAVWIEELDRHPLKAKIHVCSAKTCFQPRSCKFTDFETEQLEYEYVLMVLSPQFSCLILAHPHREQDLINGSPLMQVTCSFDPTVVAQAAKAITQRSTLPQAVAQNLSTTDSAQIDMTTLLLKQIQVSQEDTQRSRAELTAALRLKEEFLDRLVRELRPPITNMKTALRLLESKQLKRHQRQRYLEMLQRECNRQHAVITGLLELVQLDAMRSPEAVSLEELVPGIVSTYQPLAAEKGVVLGYTIAANLPPVSCPAAWLRQIIINLLDNSLKYTAPQGRVSVQAQRRKQAVEIVVSDTGVGIESQDLPKIFESFYHGRTSEELAGAGLGLTVVQQLLQRCGGSVAVTSRVGKGSTFRVSLPIAPQNQAAATHVTSG